MQSVLEEAIKREFVGYTLAVFVNRRFQATLHIFSERLPDECSEFDKLASVTTGKLLMVIFANKVNSKRTDCK